MLDLHALALHQSLVAIQDALRSQAPADHVRGDGQGSDAWGAGEGTAQIGRAPIGERFLADGDAPPDTDGVRCAAPAELWLSTGATFTNHGNGEITFVFSTPMAGQLMTFASGTSQGSIVAALNAVGGSLGLIAEQDPQATARVRLSTIATGAHQFVCVQELDPRDPGLIFASAESTDGATADCDLGEGGFFGDLDCDGEVGSSDLAILLGAWGESPHLADLDADGIVGPIDLAILLAVWDG